MGALTPQQKEMIYKKHMDGVPNFQIAQDGDFNIRTVQRTIKNYKDRNTFERKKGSGAIAKFDAFQIRQLVRFAKKNPKMTLDEITNGFPLKAHKDTIHKILQNANVRKRGEPKKPINNDKQA